MYLKAIQWFLSAAFLLLLLAGCAPHPRMVMLVKMMADQETYFRDEVAPAFEKKYAIALDVVRYESPDSLSEELKRRPNQVSLVKVPFDKSMTLLRKGVFTTLDSVLDKEQLATFKNEYLLTSVGALQGTPCLIPRKFETRIMVYCKSKVIDAVAHWRTYKDTIDEALSRYNGYGLPATYLLEDDPEQWDYFDVFVVGWIWAHTSYGGLVKSRIAHRGKRYSGTSLRVIDRIFQLGGDSTVVLTMQGDAVVDAIYWEALYTASGVYCEEMWNNGWSGVDIWKAFADGNVYLSFMTQLDCFYLHGTGRDNLVGYFKNPDDMGVATMPRGCSAQLDATSIPRSIGRKSITTGGWWWGIPTDAPNRQQSFALASFITGTTAQIQECARFGMIPVRKEILGDMSMMFGGGWISNIYEVSFKQLVENGYTTLPGSVHLDEIMQLYLDLIDEVVGSRHWSAEGAAPDREYIKTVIEQKYVPKTTLLLQGGTR